MAGSLYFLRRAQRLLHGLNDLGGTNGTLACSLRCELDRVEQRVSGLLLQLYPPALIADAQRGVSHAAREHQANALKILDNIVPRPVYEKMPK